MSETVDSEFVVYDAAETKTLAEFQTATSTPDEIWSKRIAPIPVGASFTINRPADETQRAFKKRINRAAMVSFKTLEWKSRDGSLPDDQEPTHWLVKVKALDLKAQAAAQAAAIKAAQSPVSTNGQDASNSPTEATSEQAASADGSQEGTEVPASAGPRRPR